MTLLVHATQEEET